VSQSGILVESGTVIFTDVYTDSQIATYSFESGDKGYFSFENDTTLWHAGLHQIKGQWSIYDTFNTTYIIINETISISIDSDKNSVQRNFDIFDVYGILQDLSVPLRGLGIKIMLLDGTYSDVSGYLVGPQYLYVSNGNYLFDRLYG